MHDREIFHKYFGPFHETTFVNLEDNGASFRLSFDPGPEYDFAKILSSKVTSFKFLAGTIGEIRVTYYYGKKLAFYGAQIPTFALTAKEGVLPPDLDAICISIDCLESLPCPDPSKPVLICPGGEPACSEGEG